MEVYAGYSENADYNVGRVIDAIDELGELDNTLIIWIWGDNGASMEGTITGSFNELTMQNGIPLTDEMQLQLVRALRRHRCSGAPRSWTRTTPPPGRGPATRRSSGASRSARTSAAPATRWSCTGPTRITDAGGLRSQFTHVIDVGADDPRRRRHPGADDGRRHRAGADARHDVRRLARPTRDAPEHRTQQYFETIGNRAMYKDGWWLAMKTERIPWVLTPDALAPYAPGVWDPDADPAELYYLPDDFTQAHDLAAEHPEKVAGAQGPVLGGGRAVQGPAAARRRSRRSSASCRRSRTRRRSSSAATSRTSCRA